MSSGTRDLKTPMNRVIGLGSAKEGVSHWWAQRLSSIALIPLTLLFVPPFASAIGDGHAAVLALYADPFQAIVAILFLGVTFWHLQQGLQVVVEDYIHEKPMRTALLLLNTFGCALLGVVAVFSVAKIAFAG